MKIVYCVIRSYSNMVETWDTLEDVHETQDGAETSALKLMCQFDYDVTCMDVRIEPYTLQN